MLNSSYYAQLSNNNSNATSGNEQAVAVGLSGLAKVLLYIADVTILLCGTIGNTTVIYLIGIKNKNKKNYDIHILSLSTADLLASICVPVVNIHDAIVNHQSWELFGDIGCKIFLSSNHLTILVSALMLVLISITRFQVINSSEAIHTSKCRSLFQVFVVWMFAFAIVSPYIHVSYIRDGMCGDHWQVNERFIFYCILEVTSCVLPILIMTALYTISAYRLRNHQIPGDNSSMSLKRKRQNAKITSMFKTIVVVFFCLTTPYMIYVFFGVYCHKYELEFLKSNSTYFNQAAYATYAIASFNSCVNPIIYARMHRGMKRSIKNRYVTWRNSTTAQSKIKSITSKV